eukprot:scaffold39815_cov22-Tisochrysis_lutea.AAC.3
MACRLRTEVAGGVQQLRSSFGSPHNGGAHVCRCAQCVVVLNLSIGGQCVVVLNLSISGQGVIVLSLPFCAHGVIVLSSPLCAQGAIVVSVS